MRSKSTKLFSLRCPCARRQFLEVLLSLISHGGGPIMNMNSSFTTSSTPYVPSKRRLASGLNSSMSDLNSGGVNNSFTAGPSLLPQHNRDVFYQNESVYTKNFATAGASVGIGLVGVGGVAAMPQPIFGVSGIGAVGSLFNPTQLMAAPPGQFAPIKPVELDKESLEEQARGRMTGRLKFFDEAQNYGFFVLDVDGSDLFVHYDDLKKANVSKEVLKKAKTNYLLRFSFTKMEYFGKYNQSKKAVDIKLLKAEPLGLINQI